MARTIKPTPTKVRRSRSIERCIQDAQDFIKEPKAKKIFKTRTMARTIEEAQRIVHSKPVARKTVNKSKPAKKRVSRPTRPAVPSKPAVIAPVITAAAGTKIVRARSIDKSIKPSKATIFKTSSKDHLPLPAFGFIDVCFCVDATGSMCSELAQVQSTIVSIINKI